MELFRRQRRAQRELPLRLESESLEPELQEQPPLELERQRVLLQRELVEFLALGLPQPELVPLLAELPELQELLARELLGLPFLSLALQQPWSFGEPQFPLQVLRQRPGWLRQQLLWSLSPWRLLLELPFLLWLLSPSRQQQLFSEPLVFSQLSNQIFQSVLI